MTITIRIGDCRELLAAMPDESVNCIVTSPPYWGLRDYGVAGQIGMEPTLAQHLEIMVQVFRECRRVLRKDGTCWVNYGDCYATHPNGRSAADTKATGNDDRTFRDKPFSTIQGTMKPKDLCMIPNRLAIALQDDGWWVRSEIIWHKLNPMPDSATDRPTPAHEKMFLLTRSARYWYDADAVRTPLATKTLTTFGTQHRDLGNDAGDNVKASNWARSVPVRKPRLKKPDGWDTGAGGHGSVHRHGREKGETAEVDQLADANLRNVWSIATAPFSEAHFATFPPALVEPCVKAGCPEGGMVLDPFGGAGTVGLVADRLKRSAIMFELNPEYADIAERRIRKDAGMFTDLTVERPTTPKPRCRKKPGALA